MTLDSTRHTSSQPARRYHRGLVAVTVQLHYKPSSTTRSLPTALPKARRCHHRGEVGSSRVDAGSFIPHATRHLAPRPSTATTPAVVTSPTRHPAAGVQNPKSFLARYNPRATALDSASPESSPPPPRQGRQEEVVEVSSFQGRVSCS